MSVVGHAIHLIKDAWRDLAPTLVVVAFFQALFVGTLPEDPVGLVGGFLIVILGLGLFVKGLEAAIFPAGESMAFQFARKGSLFWLALFTFGISFASVVAEPALMAVAYKAAMVSSGSLDALTIRLVAAAGVGLSVVIGVWRIIAGHPTHWYLIPGYILVIALTAISPPQLVGLAFDSGGVVASTVTAPLLTALGVGLAISVHGRNPLSDGFGLIAFGALAPMIIIQIYGIFFFTPAVHGETVLAIPSSDGHGHTPMAMLLGFLMMLRNLLPIAGVVLFFSFLILKKPLANPVGLGVGAGLVAVGLYLFDVGLQIGLFPLGDAMTRDLLSEGGPLWVLYAYGFLIGFATTMAEPALIALSIKADEVSLGQIKAMLLRVLVSIGVGIGIVIGCERIISGTPIAYWLIAGYGLVVALTTIAPAFIIPIAYDSGGVTTSTVTVPLVAAVGIGLAERTPGRDPMIDGFGLIAFASLVPMLIVMSYGLIAATLAKRQKGRV